MLRGGAPPIGKLKRGRREQNKMIVDGVKGGIRWEETRLEASD